MSMVSWPFDATVTQDTQGNPVYSRTYSSDVLAKILAKYFRNGVFNTAGNDMQVVESSGMNVSLLPGHCLINGRHGYSESAETLAVGVSSPSLPRKDLIVLRLDLGVSALSILPFVVAGTPAASPSAPALTRNSTVYELALAEVYVGTGVTAISQSNITDTRLDTDRCGVVASIIGDTDTTAYYAQIAADLAEFKAGREADFDAWFTTIQGILGEDEAGNLLNLINAYRAKTAVVTLNAADWTGSGPYTQVKSVSIVPLHCALYAGPAEASRVAYNDAGVRVPAASTGSVTFTATSLPTDALTVLLVTAETSSGGVRVFNAGAGTVVNTCSTVESWTGHYIYDSTGTKRKLFQKILIYSGTPSGGAFTIAHGINNLDLDEFIKCDVGCYQSSGYALGFPYAYLPSTGYAYSQFATIGYLSSTLVSVYYNGVAISKMTILMTYMKTGE